MSIENCRSRTIQWKFHSFVYLFIISCILFIIYLFIHGQTMNAMFEEENLIIFCTIKFFIWLEYHGFKFLCLLLLIMFVSLYLKFHLSSLLMALLFLFLYSGLQVMFFVFVSFLSFIYLIHLIFSHKYLLILFISSLIFHVSWVWVYSTLYNISFYKFNLIYLYTVISFYEFIKRIIWILQWIIQYVLQTLLLFDFLHWNV